MYRYHIINILFIMYSILTGCEKNTDAIKPSGIYSHSKVGLKSPDEWIPSDSAIYINPSSTAISEDGTIEYPYHSLAKIRWKDNAVYVIKRGTVLETTATIVIAANRVTLGAYGEGSRPVIKNNSKDHTVSTGWTGGTDITIRDLEINANGAVNCIIFRDNSKNGKIINCKLHNATWGIRALNYVNGLLISNTEVFNIKDDGIFIKNSTNIEIANCYIHNVNQNWFVSTSESSAGGDGIQLEACNQWHIHHNEIDRTDTGNKFCFISNNPNQNNGIFEHNKLSGPKVNGYSIYIGDGSNLIVRYNYISGPSNSPFYSHASNLKIYYNIFNDINGPLFASNSAEVYNNLFYHMSMGIQGGNIIARNNIFDLGSANQPCFKVTKLTEDHNLTVSGKITNNSQTGNVEYEDAARGNFHLKAGSDAINKGTNVNLKFDMDGNEVPKGGIPDIGPYEFIQ